MSKHAFLEIWDLEKSYPKGKGKAIIVEHFHLDVAEGEFISVIGHSGCGKSTVLAIVAGLSEATHGFVRLGGVEVRGAGTDRGVVFQAPCLFPWMTALQNVTLGLEQTLPASSRAERERLASEQLELLGLGDSLHKLPAALSQGMRQRVGLARAFALNPRMLLLDEPFGMLDSLTRYELQEVLVELWSRDRKTTMMVTHDVDEALFLSDRIVMMTSGPRATVGEVLDVPFGRPRERERVLNHPLYATCRERIIAFLEEQGHPGTAATGPTSGMVGDAAVGVASLATG